MKIKLYVLFILFVLAPCFAETDTASFELSAYKNTTNVTAENLVYNIYVENLYDSQTGLIESGGSAEQPSENNIIFHI